MFNTFLIHSDRKWINARLLFGRGSLFCEPTRGTWIFVKDEKNEYILRVLTYKSLWRCLNMMHWGCFCSSWRLVSLPWDGTTPPGELVFNNFLGGFWFINFRGLKCQCLYSRGPTSVILAQTCKISNKLNLWFFSKSTPTMHSDFILWPLSICYHPDLSLGLSLRGLTFPDLFGFLTSSAAVGEARGAVPIHLHCVLQGFRPTKAHCARGGKRELFRSVESTALPGESVIFHEC